MNPSANKAIGSLLAACGLESDYQGSSSSSEPLIYAARLLQLP